MGGLNLPVAAGLGPAAATRRAPPAPGPVARRTAATAPGSRAARPPRSLRRSPGEDARPEAREAEQRPADREEQVAADRPDGEQPGGLDIEHLGRFGGDPRHDEGLEPEVTAQEHRP